jgi:hypothetical protein
MIDTASLLSIILVLFNFVSFGIGYIIGRLNNSSYTMIEKPISKRNKQYNNNEKSQNKIIIDDRKFVTDISVDGMEKKYNELGNTRLSNENISESVNKLQNLKR